MNLRLKRLLTIFMTIAYVTCSYNAIIADEISGSDETTTETAGYSEYETEQTGESSSETAYVTSESTNESDDIVLIGPVTEETTGESSDELFTETTPESSDITSDTTTEETSYPSGSVTAYDDIYTDDIVSPTATPVFQPTPTVAAETSETAEITEGSVTADTQISDDILTNTVLDWVGDNYTITASFGPETGIPSDARLQVTEITEGEDYYNYLARTSETIEEPCFNGVRFFDICIVKDGIEYEPAQGTTVSVSIALSDMYRNDLMVVHIPDDAEAEIIGDIDFTSDLTGTEVSFDADGFSVYALVDGPAASLDLTWKTADSIDVINSIGTNGFYVCMSYSNAPNTRYFLNGGTVSNVTDNSDRNGLDTTTSTDGSIPNNIQMFYFEQTTGGYYIYTLDGQGNPQYLQLTTISNTNYPDRGSINLVSSQSDATVFSITLEDGKFLIHADAFCKGQMRTYYLNRNTKNAGYGAIAAYASSSDANIFRATLYYHDDVGTDPYNLNGKSYGLIHYDSGVLGTAILADAVDSDHLAANPMTVLTQGGGANKKILLPSDIDITMWSFTWAHDDYYYITGEVDGDIKYLTITDTGLAMTSTPEPLRVVPGTGNHAGRISLENPSSDIVYYTGDADQGFTSGTPDADRHKWLAFGVLSELTSDYFMTYSATKVSVSAPDPNDPDAVGVVDGSKVIIYTRVWNENTMSYDFYAVDHDGSLVPCYSRGNEIQWVGNGLNTMLWDFTEYHYDDGTPNYYYELYNEYSGNYIAPDMNGHLLSPDKIGINLNGRRNGQYYTTIIAWDDDDYAYSAVTTNGTNSIISTNYANATDFYFAIVNDISTYDDTHRVATVDNNDYGITMRMIDCPDRNSMSNILGNDEGGMGNTLHQGLLSTNLGDDGYPTVMRNNSHPSLNQLYNVNFGQAQEVNHLFIESTYHESGYFEYDCSQNFATLQDDGNFYVYQELGTSQGQNGNESKDSLKHGQFLPYNDIEIGNYSQNNPQNVTDILGNRLSSDDPRYGEPLHMITGTPDFFFAMEVEASFIQTPSGQDDWGHDIIFEFTGDDDFWLYVDGELVIDLGGIHSAVPGSINYRTGVVNVNGHDTTLRELFYSNYIARGMTPAEANALCDEKFVQNDAGQWVFDDYTSHTMKIFYMERGAGASNLRMRFNLSSVLPGTVLLSKDVTGVDEAENSTMEFMYQIQYRETPEGSGTQQTHYLTNDPGNPMVFYRGTNRLVEYENSYTTYDGVTYNNVFFLHAGEECEIHFPPTVTVDDYRIVECGVNTNIYDNVYVNDPQHANPLTGVPRSSNRSDYAIDYAAISGRPSVAYENEVNPNALRDLTFTKILYDETGVNEIHDDPTPFYFRLYLGSEFDTGSDLTTANMADYHVMAPDGRYCRWDSANQEFVPLEGEHSRSYELMTDAEKVLVTFTTSMNGSISKIPAFYTVLVRNVLVDSQFMVEERSYEIPDGYSLQQYNLYEDYFDQNPIDTDDKDPIRHIVEEDCDPYVEVCNIKGWGLRINKVWNDDPYMDYHDPVYFAVFNDDGTGNLTLRPDTVRELPNSSRTLYWYFQTLGGIAFENYVVREVTLSNDNPTVDHDTGVVTNYGTVTVIDGGGTNTVNALMTGEAAPDAYTYSVHYDQSQVAPGSNVRVDTVTNDRQGLRIYKHDWNNDPLGDAVFTLTDADGNVFGPFSSDASNGNNGLVTEAFLREGVEYTLSETRTPQGYHGLDTPITIEYTNGSYVVNGADASYYSLETDNSGHPYLVVKNIPYVFQVVKYDRSTDQPVQGIHFALHRQVTIGHVTVVDFNPIEGYEDLVSDANGIIPLIDNTLPPGTYELREKQNSSPDYYAIDVYIRFTVTELGDIILGVVHPDVILNETVNAQNITYTISVFDLPVEASLIISKEVTGNFGNRNEDEGFEVTVTFTNADNTPYTQPVNWTLNGVSQGPTTLDSQGRMVFRIRHGETAVFKGLPDGTKFVVTENPGLYDGECYLDGVLQPGLTANGVVGNNLRVRYVNNRNALIPTGIAVSAAPVMIALTLLITGSIIICINNKRRRREEFEG